MENFAQNMDRNKKGMAKTVMNGSLQGIGDGACNLQPMVCIDSSFNPTELALDAMTNNDAKKSLLKSIC